MPITFFTLSNRCDKLLFFPAFAPFTAQGCHCNCRRAENLYAGIPWLAATPHHKEGRITAMTR